MTYVQPGDTKSTDTKSGDTKMIYVQPAGTKPGDTKSTDTKSPDTKMIYVQPGDTKPGDTKSTDTKSPDTKLVYVQPADTKPGDTKPTDTKSGDTKMIYVRPADTKPGDTKSTDTKVEPEKPKIDRHKDTLARKAELRDKLNEKQLKDISEVANNQNIIFKIQLVAVKSELKPNHSLLKNVLVPVKKEKSADGWFRYYTGSFKTYEKALIELNKIKSNGANSDAFIVAFKAGKKITVADAKNILK